MSSMEVESFSTFDGILTVTGGGSGRFLPKCIAAYKANRFAEISLSFAKIIADKADKVLIVVIRLNRTIYELVYTLNNVALGKCGVAA